MNSIYAILNADTKNWWHNRQLREQGQLDEARQRERSSIRSNVATLRKVLQHGGYLSMARFGWTLQVFEHLSYPNDPTSTSKKTYTVSGYYNLSGSCPYYEICKRLAIPIIDTRDLSLEQAFEVIKLPLIAKSRDAVDEGTSSLDYVSLNSYCMLLISRFSNAIVLNLSNESENL